MICIFKSQCYNLTPDDQDESIQQTLLSSSQHTGAAAQWDGIYFILAYHILTDFMIYTLNLEQLRLGSSLIQNQGGVNFILVDCSRIYLDAVSKIRFDVQETIQSLLEVIPDVNTGGEGGGFVIFGEITALYER